MMTLVNGTDQAFDALERRAQRACVIFHDQLMPPGSDPDRARLGVEIRSEAVLFVERGITYSGQNDSVRSWLQEGEMRFPSFLALRDWIRRDLATCFPGPAEATGHRPSSVTPDLLSPPIDSNSVEDAASRYVDEGALFDALTLQVLGQDDAIRTLTKRTVHHRARRAPRRPLTLFAIGPTGVGKTRSAEMLPQALSHVSQDSGRVSYLRLDMPEYQERHRVSQLLGAPQGYIGYGQGAQFVDMLAADPQTIVLFDEIEKAHPDVLRTLMNAMDAGRLSTSAMTAHGRQIDCRSAIFLFTSNLAADPILSELRARDGFADSAIVNEVCRRHLRASGIAPELIGRITAFLVFQPLSYESRAAITALAIASVAEEYGLHVTRVDPVVVAKILERVGEDAFGARPLEYMVDDFLGAAFIEAGALGFDVPMQVCDGMPCTCMPATMSCAEASG